jgi:hypothetical protein
MRPSTYVHPLFYGYCFQNYSTIRIEGIAKKKNSLYGTNIKTQFSHMIYTGRSCSFPLSSKCNYPNKMMANKSPQNMAKCK